VTMEQAMQHVTGILMHPVFTKIRPDVVISPGPNHTVTVSGPRNHLDGISRALQTTGVGLHRPAPALLQVAF
jgi:hypothetical protein